MDFLVTPIRVSGIDNFFTIPVYDENANVIQHDIYIAYNGLESWSTSELQCCTIGGITQGITYGDSFYNPADGRWEFLNAESFPERVYSGVAVIGACCVTGLSFDISGQIEILNNGYDCLAIYLNGVQKFYTDSEAQEDADDLDTTGVFYTYTMPLTPRPCGNIITIASSTVDEIANNGVKWSVGINKL